MRFINVTNFPASGCHSKTDVRNLCMNSFTRVRQRKIFLIYGFMVVQTGFQISSGRLFRIFSKEYAIKCPAKCSGGHQSHFFLLNFRSRSNLVQTKAIIYL